MTATNPPGGAVQRPGLWGALAGCLLDFEAFPGRYPLALREPRLLFDHATEVLALASGRAMEGSPCDEALEARMRRAARFFVRIALLRPGVDNYTLLGLAPGFDPADLREHYRMLIRLTHPDFAGEGGEWPAGAATRINLANELLSSPVRQLDYERAQRGARQWAPSAQAPVVPRAGAGARPAGQRARHAATRHRKLLAGGAAAGALVLGLWLWSGASDDGPDATVALAGSAAQPAPAPSALAPEPVAAAPPPATGLTSAQTAGLAPAASAPAATATPAAAATPLRPVRQNVASAAAPVGLARPPEGLRPAPAEKGAALTVASPAKTAAAPALPPAWAGAPAVVPAVTPPPASTPAAASPALPVPVLALASPAPVQPPAPSAMALPAARAPAAPDAAPPGAPVSMEDVQPLLGHLLGALQSGSGEQVMRWVERPARPGEGADGFVQTYNRMVGQSRSVRLGAVRFSGRPVGDQLQVDGVVMLHLQDEAQQPATRELVLRAQFASRDGQPVLTQLSASEPVR